MTKNHTIEYAPKTTLPGLVICFSFFCFLSCVYVLNTLVMVPAVSLHGFLFAFYSIWAILSSRQAAPCPQHLPGQLENAAPVAHITQFDHYWLLLPFPILWSHAGAPYWMIIYFITCGQFDFIEIYISTKYRLHFWTIIIKTILVEN